MSAVTTARIWSVRCPRGMLAFGHTVKRFSSPDSFDQYLRCVREAGFVVRFDTPWFAILER